MTDKNLYYSISDISDWQKLKVVPSDIDYALGRQFIINTYLTFISQVTPNGNVNSLKIGQLADMGKITPLERLCLLLFGCGIILIILICLVIKLVSRKKGDDAATGAYIAHENS